MDWTWRVHDLFWFISIRNYNGFVVDMDSLDQANLRFSKELQWFRGGHGFFSSRESSFLQGMIMFSWWTWILWDRQIGVKSASSPPRPKSAPRGSKSTTFAGGFCSALQSSKKWYESSRGSFRFINSISDIYLWLQAEVWEAFAIGGWCVVSCTSIQISKLTVQP